MLSLKEYDCKKFSGQPLVSKAAMAALQQKALEHDRDSEEMFRGNMIRLGISVAKEEAKKNGTDPDYLLQHIDPEILAETGYRRPFSVFENETIHIDTVRTYIQAVHNRIYTTTSDGQKIKTELYDKTAKTLNQNICLYSIPHPIVPGVSADIIAAVRNNEIRTERQKMLDKAKFQRLKAAVRDSDLPYEKKLNLLMNLTEAGELRRCFFYYLFGVDDGAAKSLAETARHFGLNDEKAEQIYLRTLNRYAFRLIRPCLHDGPYLISNMSRFLCKTRQNRMGRKKFRSVIKRCRNRF